jgi:predicted  nucleic acid-binding Zn-ribbon protein
MILGTKCGEGWQELELDDEYGDWVRYEDVEERIAKAETENREVWAVIREYSSKSNNAETTAYLEELLRNRGKELLPTLDSLEQQLQAQREEIERLKEDVAYLKNEDAKYQELQRVYDLVTHWRQESDTFSAKCDSMTGLQTVLDNLIAGMCRRCAKGDALQIEPSTGHYTHTLGGNFCSASFIHIEIAAQKARTDNEVGQ